MHDLALPAIPNGRVAELAEAIQRTGYAVVRDYVAQQAINELREALEERIRANGGQSLHLKGGENVSETLLGSMAHRIEFVDLLKQLHAFAFAPAPANQSIYQVTRCLKGESGLPHAFIFHFDSYVVTALLPIAVPDCRDAGTLILVPNVRRVRRHYHSNLVEKILLHNPLSQFWLKEAYRSGRLKGVLLKMRPGDLYLFWGYRTLHANELCDPDHLRATALFHFGDPHSDSWLRRAMGRAVARTDD